MIVGCPTRVGVPTTFTRDLAIERTSRPMATETEGAFPQSIDKSGRLWLGSARGICLNSQCQCVRLHHIADMRTRISPNSMRADTTCKCCII